MFTLSSVNKIYLRTVVTRGGSRAAATSKMEHFVIIANGYPPLVTAIGTTQPLYTT